MNLCRYESLRGDRSRVCSLVLAPVVLPIHRVLRSIDLDQRVEPDRLTVRGASLSWQFLPTLLSIGDAELWQQLRQLLAVGFLKFDSRAGITKEPRCSSHEIR